MAGYYQDSSSVDWNTPASLVRLIREAFGGEIDLDPCSNATSVVHARRNVCLSEDGLKVPWIGRVYVNPPFGDDVEQWYRKAFVSGLNGARVILLAPGHNVSAKYWHRYSAEAVCFLKGRVHYDESEIGAPFPSMLMYFGSIAGRNRFADVFNRKTIGTVLIPYL